MTTITPIAPTAPLITPLRTDLLGDWFPVKPANPVRSMTPAEVADAVSADRQYDEDAPLEPLDRLAPAGQPNEDDLFDHLMNEAMRKTERSDRRDGSHGTMLGGSTGIPATQEDAEVIASRADLEVAAAPVDTAAITDGLPSAETRPNNIALATALSPAPSSIEDHFAATGEIPTQAFDITRHDAIITVHNPATGQHRTFKIESVRPARYGRESSMTGKRIVSLLVGPSDYQGFAFADSFGVKVWSKFRSGGANARMGGEQTSGRTDNRAGNRTGKQEQSKWEKFARMLERPSVYEAKGVEYRISLRCLRCGRALTHPSSLTDSMGPECRAKA